MRNSQTTIRHLRVFGALALILLVFLTACSTGSDSTSVSPTREAATPMPGASARSVSAPAISTAITTATAPTGLPDPERAALTALYDATGGQDWKINDGWLSDAPLGRWQRVITDENGQVTGLDLGSNRLSGEIPTELEDLSNLKLLFISDNELTGELPQGLTGLSGLESFHFHDNSGLCAPIDETFQTWLQGIASVIGSSCALQGSLEDREALVELYGALDGENWTNSTNWLTERPIREWHGVTNDASGRVTGLMLEGNELTGEMPAGLGSLSNLKRLEFSNNHLTGEIPTELGNLSSLENLILDSNLLNGEIPTELGSLSSLKRLELGMNRITGEIPAELGNLTSLEVLILAFNRLSGEIPAELGGLSNLKSLELAFNELTRIHRRRALGTALEEARGCPHESGIMVL